MSRQSPSSSRPPDSRPPGSRPPGSSQPPQRGGGVFIAGGLVLGAGFGMATGEPSLGLLVGLVAGVVLALIMAVLDRR